jgi:hypothetical protein
MDDLILSPKGKGKIAVDGTGNGWYAPFTAYFHISKIVCSTSRNSHCSWNFIWPNILKLKAEYQI